MGCFQDGINWDVLLGGQKLDMGYNGFTRKEASAGWNVGMYYTLHINTLTTLIITLGNN